MNYAQSDQIPLAPPPLPRKLAERKAEIEVLINQSFSNFLADYSIYQTFTIFIFLTLIIGIELSEYQYIMPLGFLLLAGFYVIYLLKIFSETSHPVKRAQTGYNIVEFAVTAALMYNFRKPNDNSYMLICGAFLLISFLIKSLISYMVHHSTTVKFLHQANQKIAILKACIFVQGVILLAQLSWDNPLPYFIVLLPIAVIAGLIGLLAAKLFESIFFTYRSQIWDSSIGEKKRGIIWLFGNLFSLIFLLLSSFVSFSSVLSKPADSYLGLFSLIAIWCSLSSFTSESARNGLYHIYYALVMILETKDEADEMQKIKYVLKLSNTYYRPATEQEIKQAKKNKFTGDLREDSEADIGDHKEEGVKCIICCKEAPDSVFMQCGHGGICFECGQEIRKKQECHMCRQRIKGLLKVDTENNKGNLYEVVTTVTNRDDDL